MATPESNSEAAADAAAHIIASHTAEWQEGERKQTHLSPLELLEYERKAACWAVRKSGARRILFPINPVNL